jgi:serpin B
VSPASIRIALAMTAVGARGVTADELDRTLGLPTGATRADATAGFGALLAALRDRPPATLRLANRLWPQQGEPLEAPFLAQVAAGFGAAPEPLPFASDPAAARAAINAWVAGQTAQRIPELLGPDAIDASTRLVLTNAVYFKGAWATAFEPERTLPGPFTTAAGKIVTAQRMHRTGKLRYGENDTYRVVELPYQGDGLVMQVLLPQAGKTLTDVAEPALTGLGVLLQPREVQLELPRLRLRTHVSLVPTLKAMGVSAALAPGADFTGIDGGRGQLYISDVIHAADLDLDEAGTVAVAATAVTMTKGAAPPPATPIPFVVDQPYLLLLRDTKTGTTLFLARVVDPTA